MSCCLLFNVGNQVQFHASRSLVEFSASVTHPTFNHFVSPSIQHLLSPLSSDAFSFYHSSCHNHDVTASLSSSYSRKRLVIPSTKKSIRRWAFAKLGLPRRPSSTPELSRSRRFRHLFFFSKTKQKKKKKNYPNGRIFESEADVKACTRAWRLLYSSHKVFSPTANADYYMIGDSI